MAQTHAASGQIVSVRPLGEALADSRTVALMKGAQLEVVRLVLPAGKGLPEHQAPGEITVHCLEGLVDLSIGPQTHRLAAGDWVHLAARARHALRAHQDSSLLVTICLAPG